MSVKTSHTCSAIKITHQFTRKDIAYPSIKTSPTNYKDITHLPTGSIDETYPDRHHYEEETGAQKYKNEIEAKKDKYKAFTYYQEVDKIGEKALDYRKSAEIEHAGETFQADLKSLNGISMEANKEIFKLDEESENTDDNDDNDEIWHPCNDEIPEDWLGPNNRRNTKKKVLISCKKFAEIGSTVVIKAKKNEPNEQYNLGLYYRNSTGIAKEKINNEKSAKIIFGWYKNRRRCVKDKRSYFVLPQYQLTAKYAISNKE
ncbi:19306_t:CDS:2 [Dentiscutata erythropus]|uniref:19306_t:CDS:1 n=1 Tax=Dentiscutata erythropus TaxID=1348616 RepID=A0A9N9DFL9_9GLOM|nr:19306_t:CDS:2 [Dentiscutata erythropus]